MRSPAGSRPPRGSSRRHGRGPSAPGPAVAGIEIETAAELPRFLDEIVAAADGVLGAGRAPPARPGRRRPPRSRSTRTATWIEGTLADGDGRVADRPRALRRAGRAPRLRRPRRRRDPRDRLAAARAGARRPDRRRARDRPGRRPRPRSSSASRPTTRPTSRGARRVPRRDASGPAQHLIEHDLVTIPDDERIEVIATPEYLRSVMPFAAYFEPAPFDADAKGIYVVTPSVDGDPGAHARAQPRLDQQHEHPRGLPGPPPPARRRARGTRR